jgi:hypothetical protein
MRTGLESLRLSPDPSPSRPPNKTSSTSHDVILDHQFPLRVSIDIQGQDIRITAQDETGNRVGLLEAQTAICNGANPLLKKIECPDVQPGIGYVLICEINQLAEKKGGNVSYSGVDGTSRQWLTDNGLTNLLNTPATPNT